MESFNQEMIASGYQENKQVGSQICNCFVYEINNGNTIGQARKTCKEDALKTVDLQKTNLL
ncbi:MULTISPECIES: hypothetical protein [unclassified Prochlorococcus]|uniref:hypothetical protein n=1 Tax=unclassified Prochlorococcus TaxID=2627481 RepID=UPI00053399D7|nr:MULTISPECIES: hypothetical protein [unclassified Prochlorococcus]KGG15420.1 hypothetical protein EV06_1291 [Prochlorococcus sp. MIT 0602]KGG17698.1 hypothetical protein EV07_1138 [Prochlorococcus sp. MIT 0603]